MPIKGPRTTQQDCEQSVDEQYETSEVQDALTDCQQQDDPERTTSVRSEIEKLNAAELDVVDERGLLCIEKARLKEIRITSLSPEQRLRIPKIPGLIDKADETRLGINEKILEMLPTLEDEARAENDAAGQAVIDVRKEVEGLLESIGFTRPIDWQYPQRGDWFNGAIIRHPKFLAAQDAEVNARGALDNVRVEIMRRRAEVERLSEVLESRRNAILG